VGTSRDSELKARAASTEDICLQARLVQPPRVLGAVERTFLQEWHDQRAWPTSGGCSNPEASLAMLIDVHVVNDSFDRRRVRYRACHGEGSERSLSSWE